MSLYKACVPQMSKMLRNLSGWLDKAEAYAEERGFDAEALLVARLAPDQFTLRKQIQSACDGAKFAACRLGDKEPPKHEDGEQSLAELRARIEEVLEQLAGFSEADFKGSAKKEMSLFFLPGKKVLGTDYFNEFINPNFYFHVVTAYAILRHNGVPLGKKDFLGSITMQDA